MVRSTIILIYHACVDMHPELSRYLHFLLPRQIEYQPTPFFRQPSTVEGVPRVEIDAIAPIGLASANGRPGSGTADHIAYKRALVSGTGLAAGCQSDRHQGLVRSIRYKPAKLQIYDSDHRLASDVFHRGGSGLY